MQTIIRAPHDVDHPFVIESRAASQDARLSYEARGVLNYLLSKPDDWRIEPDDLICDHCGRDKVYRILKELVTAGYLKRDKVRGASGHWNWSPYQLHEATCAPYPDFPDTVQPYTVNPDTVQPDTVQPDTEKPEIKESVSFPESVVLSSPLISGDTEQQDTDTTGEGAEAPTPPERAMGRTKLERAKANAYVQAFIDAFPDGFKPTVVANMLDAANALKKAGYTAEQLTSLVSHKLSGNDPRYDYKMRYAVEDMTGHLMRQARVRTAAPSRSPSQPSRYDGPATPELYRKREPAKATP